MVGKNTWLPERDPEKVEPIRYKILVELVPEKPKSKLVLEPDNLKKGDTTRQAFWAVVVKVGSKVRGTQPGLKVVMDPSLDIMSMMRCFRWEGRHFMLADVSDIIMVREDAHEKASA